MTHTGTQHSAADLTGTSIAAMINSGRTGQALGKEQSASLKPARTNQASSPALRIPLKHPDTLMQVCRAVEITTSFMVY